MHVVDQALAHAKRTGRLPMNIGSFAKEYKLSDELVQKRVAELVELGDVPDAPGGWGAKFPTHINDYYG